MFFAKCLTLILIFSIIFIVNSYDDPGIMWMKMAKCKVNSEFIYPNYSCFAKPYSRNISTITYYLAYKKTLTHLLVKIQKKNRTWTHFLFPAGCDYSIQVRNDLPRRFEVPQHRSLRASSQQRQHSSVGQTGYRLDEG